MSAHGRSEALVPERNARRVVQYEGDVIERGRVGVVTAMRPLVFGLLLAAVVPALASEFGNRYPAGAIKDLAQAERALREGDAEAARIEREGKMRDAECHKRFLVTRCREEVRRDTLAAERELRRVRVEAHDLQRQVEAQESARKRAEAAERAGKAADVGAVPAPGAAPAPTPPTAPRGAPRAGSISPEEAARNREAHERRVAEKQKRSAEEAAQAAERADNALEYREKQAQAAERARQKEAERKKNEAQRAERRKQVEAQEAQRAEVRRRAEEAAKAAPRQ
jgi:hypothetical protein